MKTGIIKPISENKPVSDKIKTKLTDISQKPEEKTTENKSLMNKDKLKKQTKETHKAKAETVTKLVEKIKNAKTLMIVSIKNLPSKQFQSIKKSLRGKALVKVAKKNIMLRTIKEFRKESILPLEKQIQENCAFVISDIEGFELAGILSEEKTPASAKSGQIAPEDIEVKAGPTSLVPGPAISELGALGIQIAIEEGKILIKAPKVIIRKGGEINEGAASILQKLDIHPFNVGLEPLAIYDTQEEKIYSNIKIDSKEVVEDLKICAGKALGFAQKILYYCKDTIGYFIGKANVECDALNKLAPSEEKVEEKKEEKPVEKKGEKETNEDQTTEDSSNKPITDIEEDKITNKNPNKEEK